MKYADIKATVNDLLYSKYPESEYTIYGKEVKEGYDTPAFFTEIIDGGSHNESKNYAQGRFIVQITYFQKVKSELDQLNKADEIKELFGLYLSIGNRRLGIKEFSYDFVGEYSDILQISVDFEYYENTKKEDTSEKATELDLAIRKEQEDGCTEY